MKDIEVSVICLTFNHEKYIRKAIDSFLMQKTNFKYEIIIHDDCSKDNTAQIIKEYEGKYPDIIKPIIQKENQYSKGIDLMKEIIVKKISGKYIAYCDGDDYWLDENKLQSQYEIMEKNKNCSICTHKAIFCDEQGNLLERTIPSNVFNLHQSCLLPNDKIAKMMFEDLSYIFHTTSYFMKKEIFDDEYYAGNWRNKTPRDIHWLQSAVLLGDFYYIDKIMSVRRRDVPTSWTMTQKKKDYEGKLEVIKERMDDYYKFDKYSKHKYHNYIEKGLYNGLVSVAKYKKDLSLDLCKEYELNIKGMIKQIGFKQTIKYLILTKVPSLYRFIKSDN